jgi:Domain of unknown function (DUF4430)
MIASGAGRMSRRAVVALVGLFCLFVATPDRFAAAQSGAVALVIDYNDGVVKSYANLPWTKGMTVLDMMNAAKAHTHGITFEFTGRGGTAFLTQIDDVKNEGGGAGKKNWQFSVNSTYADRGFGIYEVQAGDVVIWGFSTSEPK